MSKTERGIALVTGASSGIGLVTAQALRRDGYRVFGTSRKPMPDTADGITMLICDVINDASVQSVVDEVLSRAGRIDLLVNNAGIGLLGGAEESTTSQAKAVFDVNVFGIIRMTNAVLPVMRRQRRGRIVNLSSILGLIPAPYNALYASTKHAIEGYSESLDHEVRTQGIRIVLVEPGVTRTSFEENITRPDRPLVVYDTVILPEKLQDRSASCAASCPSPSSTRTFGNSAGFPHELSSPDCWRCRLTTETKGNLMKSFLIDRYTKGGALRLGESPEPELRNNDVMVEIHGAGVNVLDNKIRDGEFKLILPYRLPLALGNDVAGVVVRIGANVRQFKPGDEVYARPAQDRIGTFAEYIAMDEADVAMKPNNLTMEEAASIPLVALTAWQVLVERANLQKGQKVLIHAGSGGVGTIAIQLAKHLGAYVATTTSTANIALVKSLGADVVVDYKKDDFEKVLQGYDVVLNSLGKDTLEKSLAVLKPGGKLISISGPPDPDFARENGSGWLLQQVMRLLSSGIRRKSKRRGISYSFLFMTANGGQLGKITSLIEAGNIRPVMDRVFPFEKTNEALAYVETGRAKGKVVVTVK